jgi:hypothetical protein
MKQVEAIPISANIGIAFAPAEERGNPTAALDGKAFKESSLSVQDV